MSGTVITLAQQKGGSGKTTLAAHLAVAFARAGRSVALLDVDPQGSLGEWYERREKRLGGEGIDVGFRTASGWGARREGRSLAREHDMVIIDTPPKTDLDLRPALEIADLVIVPIQPTPVDMWATDPTLAMVAKERTRSLLVINRANRRASLTAEMVAAIGGLGHAVAATQIGNRVAFAASMGSGATVMETMPSGPAALEIAAVANEIGGAVR